MFTKLLTAFAFFTFILGQAQAVDPTFSKEGFALETFEVPYLNGDVQNLVLGFSVPNPEGITLSAQVFGPYSDLIPYGTYILDASVQGAGSYVLAASVQNFLSLSAAYLPQGDWQLIMNIITAPLGGSVTVFLSATPSPFVSDVPEPSTLSFVLAGCVIGLLIARKRGWGK